MLFRSSEALNHPARLETVVVSIFVRLKGVYPFSAQYAGAFGCRNQGMDVPSAVLVDLLIHCRLPLLGVRAGYCLVIGLRDLDAINVLFGFD